MAINLKTLGKVDNQKVNFLAYGVAGSGKTRLIPSLPNPVVISAEAGLLSIAGSGLPFVEVKTVDEVTDAFRWLKESSEAQSFDYVAVDSIS